MLRKQECLPRLVKTCCRKNASPFLKIATEFSPQSQNLGGGQWRRCGGTCSCAQGSSSCDLSHGRHEASNSCTANCIHVEGYSTIWGSQGPTSWPNCPPKRQEWLRSPGKPTLTHHRGVQGKCEWWHWRRRPCQQQKQRPRQEPALWFHPNNIIGYHMTSFSYFKKNQNKNIPRDGFLGVCFFFFCEASLMDSYFVWYFPAIFVAMRCFRAWNGVIYISLCKIQSVFKTISYDIGFLLQEESKQKHATNTL